MHPVGVPGTFPLSTGSSWNYAQYGGSENSNGAEEFQYTQQFAVAGTFRFEGKDYRDFRARVGSDDSPGFLRQEGNIVYAVPPADTAQYRWSGRMRASLPWKLFDFDAPAGSSWIPFSAVDTTSASGGFSGWSGSIYSMKVEALGICSVTVPAGSFSGVYHFRATQISESQIPEDLYYQTDNSTEDYYVVVSLGIVMRKSDSEQEMPIHWSRCQYESDLTSFHLADSTRFR